VIEASPIQKIINIVGSMSLPRVALFAAILTALYATTAYDSGDSILQTIEAAKAQLELENTKKIETQRVLKNEQQMKADVELLAKKFEEIIAKIPLEFLESDLRKTVDHYSSQNNLKTSRTDRRQSQVKISQPDQANMNLVEQVVLGYELEGSYANIAKFVSEISSLEKLIKIGDFELSVRRDSSSYLKSKDLIFKVNIIGFKQSSEVVKNSVKKENL
jgi:Tfp pilus assembly protein PilO